MLPRRRVGWGGILFCILLSGCQAAQVEHSGQQFRQALLGMYTDQVMDNLIRARCGLPFVQLSYRDLLVQDTDTCEGTISDEYFAESARGFSLPEVVSSLARTFHNTLTLGATARREKIMSFYADPVTDQNDIYETYLAFAATPNLLFVSDVKPPCPVVACRKFCGQYFWVPFEAAPLFQELVLKTTFMRGPETAPPAAYEVQIVAARDVKLTGSRDALNATLYFDKEVPNGTATLVTKLDGRTIRLRLRPIFEREDDPDKSLALGDPTKRLRAGPWSPKDQGFSPDDLLQKKARVYSHDYPPEAPTPSPLPQRIYRGVDRIRAVQGLNRS